MSASFLISDLSVILSQRDFGVTGGVTWHGVLIENVIFDDRDVEVGMGEGPTEIIPQPMLTGAAEDFVGIAESDPVTIGAETLVVSNWKVDGTGEIQIFLRRGV